MKELEKFVNKEKQKKLLEVFMILAEIDEKEDIREDFIPCLIPNWDHSPRSGSRASILHNCKPEYFYKHVMQVLNLVNKKKNKIIFLKSWNEWGEGNYMEPDIKYGRGYIEALAKALKTLE